MSKALKSAIEVDDADAARLALKSVKDLARKLPKAGTPVEYASACGAARVLEVLLEAGAPIPDCFAGSHPFTTAAEKGRVEVLKVFALRGIPAEVADYALYTSILTGREESVRAILEAVHPEITQRYLAIAAWWSDGCILDLLLSHGADINIPNRDPKNHHMHGQTALHDAAGAGYLAPVRLLVERGAAVDAADRFGRTPLLKLAASLARLDAVYRAMQERATQVRTPEQQALAEKIARQSNRYGDRAAGNPVEVLRYLLEHGADPRRVDAAGNGPLAYYHWHCTREREEANPEIVEILRQAGAPAEEAQGALLAGLRADDLAAVRAAVDAGADVNRATPLDVSTLPLILAKSAPMVELLLELGADPNRKGSSSTPLISAAGSGELEIVKLLVNAGADIHALQPSIGPSEYIANAYSAAELNSKAEVVAYLKSLGAGKPVLKDWKPMEPGVVVWENFSEVIVRGEVAAIAEALARIIGGKATTGVHGRTLTAGSRSYVVARPVTMAWCNVLTVSPARRRADRPDEKFLARLAAESGCPVMSIEYSDAAGAAEMRRYEPGGSVSGDSSGEAEMLEEIASAMGDDAPQWAREKHKNLQKQPRQELDLKKLAAQERFVIAWTSLDTQPGSAVDISFTNLPAQAFDDIAWVST